MYGKEKSRKQVWRSGRGFLYPMEDAVCSQFPDIKQFDLSKGSGIFAVDQPFDDIYDDCPVVIRYPDGKEKRSNLKDLFDEDKIVAYHAKECGYYKLLESE